MDSNSTNNYAKLNELGTRLCMLHLEIGTIPENEFDAEIEAIGAEMIALAENVGNAEDIIEDIKQGIAEYRALMGRTIQ